MSSNPSHGTVRVIDSGINCPTLPIVNGKGTAKAVIWPGNGAQYRTFQVIDLHPGDQTIELQHRSDSAYYVSSGSGKVVDLATGESHSIAEGAMLHIDRGDRYRFEAGASATMRLIGGPCPADPQLYAHLELAEAN